MSNLHEKQQNVMKRKLQEANAIGRRLKEVLDKQKANKKAGNAANDKSGLAGSAERIRNFISQVRTFFHSSTSSNKGGCCREQDAFGDSETQIFRVGSVRYMKYLKFISSRYRTIIFAHVEFLAFSNLTPGLGTSKVLGSTSIFLGIVKLRFSLSRLTEQFLWCSIYTMLTGDFSSGAFHCY